MQISPSMPIYAKITYINISGFFGITVFFVYGIVHILRGSSGLGLFELAISLGFIVGLVLLRLSASISYTQIVTSVLIYISSAVLIITGGLSGTGIYWLLVFPIILMNFWGCYKGIIWVTGNLVVISTLLLLSYFGLLPIYYDKPEVLVISVAIIVQTIFLWLKEYLCNCSNRDIVHGSK